MIIDQRQRGPDGQGIASFSRGDLSLCLGHNRLAVIDLSESAAQPMSTVDGRYHVVFNGEIYNYLEVRDELSRAGRRFLTESDTEVLLAAWAEWGPACIERLNGMFAFAIYDAIDASVHLVRDRFGVKPLYYLERSGTIAFASTPRALMRAQGGLRPDLQYVSRGLRYSVFDDGSDSSPYEGVHAVRAGHRIDIRAHGTSLEVRECRYYSLEERVAATVEAVGSCPEGALVRRLAETLQNAVDLRFRSDVPVGLSLSGGLDSSSITALSASSHGNLRGFSYGHPDEPASEGPFINSVATRCGVEMTWIRSASGTELADQFWATLEAQDAPFATSSIVAQYAVFAATRTAGVKVLLGGQGGDEALLGYHKFRVFQVRKFLSQGKIIPAISALLSLGSGLAASPLTLRQVRRQVNRYGAASERPLPGLPVSEPINLGVDPSAPLWRRQAADVTRLSLPTLLRYEDRNSMGHGVESRLPFLDYRVMELGLALPEGLKLRGRWTKWALRQAMSGRLPDEVRLSRVKRGFDTNQAHAVHSGLGAAMRGGLARGQPVLHNMLGRDPRIAPEWFSDRRLILEPDAMAQAVALLWLASRV